MKPKQIIAEAWTITKKEKRIRQWGFASTLLETLLEAKLVFWQVHFAYTYFTTGEVVQFFEIEEILYRALPFWLFLTIIILFILMVVIEFFLPKMCLGAIIGLSAKAYRKEELRGGLVLALYNFWPIFAIREIFVFSNITTTITIISLVLRYGGTGDFKYTAVGLVVFFWALSNILKFLASFGEEAIVIRKMGIFGAIGHSFKLIISYLSHVIFLILLLIMISLRILMNALMIFLIPSIAIGLGLLLTSFLPPVISYSLTTIISILLFFVFSYFLAYLHVFKQTVWTITYLELSQKKELDIILEENQQTAPIA
ncbi:hypothetical protein A3D11_00535 [Candidatus Peribacteria bacterium RIFCSPHIGHO2_02_FULL_49_16]|nr:MAG: hypothetical protein A3D11_00535 [Candidatus Peribacteria bacterium RIFCSPHIGHO2_02_FULL_49_16]